MPSSSGDRVATHQPSFIVRCFPRAVSWAIGTVTRGGLDAECRITDLLFTLVRALSRRKWAKTSYPPLARRQSRHGDAYDLYLRRHYLNQRTPVTNAEALEYFQKATALDPEYALA
jgi:hypothetical protein